MEDILVWIFWVVIIVGSIASSAAKAKKKREEEARRAAQAAGRAASTAGAGTSGAGGNARQGAGSGSAQSYGAGQTPDTGAGQDYKGYGQGAKPVGGSFADVLQELSRQLGEQPSPTVVSRPLTQRSFQPQPATASQSAYGPVTRSSQGPSAAPQPVATSHDYYSLETEYDAMDGRGYVADYSAEVMEDEIAAYERLAARRTQRSTLAPATVAAADPGLAGFPAADTDPADKDTRTTLQELLSGDFDLRRAVVEAEILTPKYLT